MTRVYFDDTTATDNFYRDTDGDGINDYYEKQIGAGYLRTGTGISLVGLDYQNPDTDGDGIPDGQEILIKIMDGKFYIMMNSNPTLKDTDGDYYPDNIDSDKLNANPMYINDKGIDDSDFHNGSTITEKTSSSYTDGRFVANQSNHTAKYEFDRSTYKYHRFSLTPEKSACYRFSGTSDLQVTYEKGLLLKKTVTVNPEPDGTYALNEKIKYTIKMKTTPSGEFSVEQDNWVYAPNGGKWTIVPYNLYYDMERMYIPSNILIEAITAISDGAITINADASVEAQTKEIMSKLKLDDSAKSGVESVVSIVSTFLGSSATVGAFVNPEPISKTTMIVAIFLDGWATYSTISAISSSLNYFEANDFKKACKSGDLNLIFTRWGYDSLFNNLWDAWTTSCYIHKYNYDSWNGYVRGTVTPNNSVQDVIDYCGL